MESRTRTDKVFDIVNIILMSILILIILYPLYFTIIASFSDPYRLMRGEVLFLPQGFTLEAYSNVMKNRQIWTGYLNTILYTISGTGLSLLITIPTAYTLSRDRLRGKGPLMIYFMFTMYFSGGMIPNYILMKQLHLLNTRASMILPVGMNVFNMIIANSFYKTSIPKELYEAASIDGSGEYRIFLQISIPLSGAILAVIALYTAVGQWNSYFSALLYLNDEDKYPLQLILRNILLMNQQMQMVTTSMDSKELADFERRQMMAETMKYALIFIASLPVLLAYPFVQKYFVKGVMIGAVKG